jgi:hypothetical protein
VIVGFHIILIRSMGCAKLWVVFTYMFVVGQPKSGFFISIGFDFVLMHTCLLALSMVTCELV